MASFTKINIRQDLYDQLKIMAAADNRSLTNYVEQLLKRHVEGTDLRLDDPEAKVKA